MRRAVKLLLVLTLSLPPRPEPIQLRIEAPADLAGFRTRLMSIDPQRLSDVATLVGLTDAGQPVQVALAPESSALARSVPTWIAGFTSQDSVVIFPSRSLSYPNDTLEDVLRHELAHALIWRTSRGEPIPRWFNEGLAMAAERQRSLEDETQLLYQLVSGNRTSLDQLDHLFQGGQNEQTRAYSLSGAIVHDVLSRNGALTGADILRRVGMGTPFIAAFSEVAGMTPDTAEFEFWQRQRIWTNWVPLLTSTTVLWLVVTLLALAAIYRHWRKNLAIAQQWEDENDDDTMKP